MRLWDAVLPLLPQGNSASVMTNEDTGIGCPPALFRGTVVRDVEALLDHLNVKDAFDSRNVVASLAVKRMDLIRAGTVNGCQIG